MFGKLVLIFIAVPLLDLFLLMYMSSYTGWQFSIGLVVVSGIVGALLAKNSSIAVGRKIRVGLQSGKMSPDLLSDGAMIFFAAGLLLTPGFLTDFFGLTLLIPVCRRWYQQRIVKWVKRNFKVQMVQSNSFEGTEHFDGTVEGSVVEKQDFGKQDAGKQDSCFSSGGNGSQGGELKGRAIESEE